MMFILGEIFSFLAAAFLGYSTFSKNKKKMAFLQIIDSTFNGISNLFLLSYSGIITNAFTATRNFLVYKNKFTNKVAIVFCILIICIGVTFNNKGPIGILPIIASVEYTIFICKSKNTNNLRLGLIFNLILWAIYDFYISSYPMFTMDVMIIFFSIFNNYRLRKVV